MTEMDLLKDISEKVDILFYAVLIYCVLYLLKKVIVFK